MNIIVVDILTQILQKVSICGESFLFIFDLWQGCQPLRIAWREERKHEEKYLNI